MKFDLYNTKIVYHICDDEEEGDEYCVSKIGNEGNTEWKWEVETIDGDSINKRSNLYKKLIDYCKEL
jgi:hypothetical protein